MTTRPVLVGQFDSPYARRVAVRARLEGLPQWRATSLLSDAPAPTRVEAAP